MLCIYKLDQNFSRISLETRNQINFPSKPLLLHCISELTNADFNLREILQGIDPE
jgi:hypothetical protein